MIRRTWTVALLWGVALGCSSGSGSSGTGGHGGGGVGTGGHAGGSAQGGHGGTAGGAGGSAGATGGTAGAVGGAAGGSAGAAGGHAGAAGGGAGAAGGKGGGTGGTACSGSAGAAGSSAGGAAGGAAGSAGTSGGGAGGANPVLARGEYLVKSVLNCGGCHTPMGGAALSGKDCFAGSTTGPDCLSSANLTNDDNGIKGLTDQQIKDAFRAGKDPDQAGAYLFSNMPYYQFANVSDDDASAIVAYLRTVPADPHKVQANAGIYATQPTAAQWAPVNPADLPAAGSAAGAANGKYLATLTCVTCHTVDATGATPQHIDATKAFP
ncbi:MAG: c-type cytochrome, partial [Verrucomicrobiota bacterium]